MPKYCRYCGGKLEESDTFCCECGREIPAKKKPVCPQCGLERKEGAKYCRRCGFALNESGQALQEAQKAGAKRQQVPRVEAGQRTYSKDTGSFYIADFAKNLLRVGNIPGVLYLILNVALIALVLASGMPEQLPAAILYSILIYLVSVTAALSPIGEFLVRYQTGCTPIRDPQMNQRLQPIFEEVYRRARKLNPSLPKNIRFYMNEDQAPNAFAVGRKTVCITQGLLMLPDEQIGAILGHEFGHLSHHDTDLLLLITVGNFFINVLFLIGRTCINFLLLIAALFVQTDLGVLMHRFVSFCCAISINLMLWLWSRIGVLLIMKTRRANEFEADHFSGEMGYGQILAEVLTVLEGGLGGKPQGVFAALSASHPPTRDRVARLRADF